MPITKHTKIDKDTLQVEIITNESHITEENRAEIKTKLDHLELEAAQSVIDYSASIGVLKAKIAILDA